MKHVIVCLDDQEVEVALKLRPVLSDMYKRSFTKKQLLVLYAEHKIALNENERKVHVEGAHTVEVRVPISKGGSSPLLHKIEKELLMKEQKERLASSLFVNKIAKFVLAGVMVLVVITVYIVCR